MTDLETRLKALLTPGGLAHVTMWDAINEYVIACGGDPSKRAHGNIPRMNAVASVDRIVLSAFRALVEAIEHSDKALDTVFFRHDGAQLARDQRNAALLAIIDGEVKT